MNQVVWKMLIRNMIFTLSLSGLLLTSACEHANDVEHYSSPGTENLDPPFSAAVRGSSAGYAGPPSMFAEFVSKITRRSDRIFYPFNNG